MKDHEEVRSEVIKKLTDLMDKVTAEKVTPDTVGAACNCAARISVLMGQTV